MSLSRCVLLLLLNGLSLISGAQINGTLRSSDGTPVKAGRIYLYSLDQLPYLDLQDKYEALSDTKDGTFHFDVKTSGPYVLYVTAVHHVPQRIWIHSVPQELQVDIQLGRHKIKEGTDTLGIIGPFNKYSTRQAIPLVKVGATTYKAKVENFISDTLFYMVTEISGDFIPAGSGAGYAPVRVSQLYNEGYLSWQLVSKGSTEVVLDLKDYRGSDTASILFKGFENNAINQIYTDINSRLRRVLKKLPNPDSKLSDIDWSAELTALSERIRKTENRAIKGACLISYLDLFTYMDSTQAKTLIDKNLVDEVFDIIPTTSTLWGLRFTTLTIFSTYSSTPQRALAYVQQLEKENSIAGLKPMALYNAIILTAKLRKDYEGLYTAFFEKYPKSSFAPLLRAKFKSDELPIAIGKTIPAFTSVLLSGRKESTFSFTDIKKDYLLIDFWATWCVPCIRELPHLLDASKKYGQKMDVLSISIDSDRKEVEAFKKKYPQYFTWQHALEAEGASGKLCKSLQVENVPTTILVNRQGKILATGNELRGEVLQATLERLLR